MRQEKENQPLQKVIILGKGAVGSTMGLYFHRALGKDFAFVMDHDRKSRYQSQPIVINDETVDFQLLDETDPPFEADLVLIATKFGQFKEAMEQAAPFVGEKTILMSALNGISSEDLLKERFKGNDVIRTIAQKMDSTYLDGQVRFTTPGELVIGMESEEQKGDYDRVLELFNRIGLPYVDSGDILYDQYKKLMANCAINQVCGAFGLTYGQAMEDPYYRNMLMEAMREVKSVANAKGIMLSEQDIAEWMDALDKLAYDSMPSLAQDLKAGRKTELELFSGTVIPLAKELGIKTPVLEDLKKRIEAKEANL